jgi:hypothetical protein
MAPELLVPEREDGSPTRPSEQSDIFSFGGIMLQERLEYSQLVSNIINSAFRSSLTKFLIITSRMTPRSSYA